MSKMTTKTKYQIGSACILFAFCVIASTLAYFYMKKNVTSQIYKETEIFIATADATRTYVKDVLRPEMTSLLPDEAFIPQAMSTSFVGREVMSRLRKRFPEFRYKRAARNPMNPINQADAFELKMIDWFNNNRESSEWHGVMESDQRSYYTRLRAIVAEAECMYCHGNPKDSPADMKAIYGTKGGYWYKEGEIVAADTIYIPIDVSIERIKNMTWVIFVLVITSLFSLMGLFFILFNRTVVLELKGLLNKFRGITGSGSDHHTENIEESGDEVEQLKLAFESVATDLEHAHEGLKASESKYRRLFEASQDAILICDAETRLVDINPAGIALFGFKDHAEAVSIETCYQLFWDPKDAKHFVQVVRDKGSLADFEVPLVDRNGRKIFARISAAARYDENNQFAGINTSLHNVTERRRLEKNMAQAEKLASIGQLASGVAHEINNPLEVIRLYSNLVAKGENLNEQAIQDIQVIQKHTENCKQIVKALLNFARVSDPDKVDTDIHAVVEDVLAVFMLQIHKKTINVEKVFMQDAPPVVLDAQQIKQVLMNILMNAGQSIETEGTITIETSVDAENNNLRLQIADTGPGIPEKIIDKIFDPFFTTKKEGSGTGLGLSVSYGIIKQHGGDIEVNSLPGKGTEFVILIPLSRTEENPHG
jgi:PAS domain S-box-containing protein